MDGARRVRVGLIDADLDECAIVVEFTVEASLIGPPPEEQRYERSEKKRKMIRIENMTEDTDVELLAEHVVATVTSLDLRSKTPIITMLLEQMQQQMASESDRHARRRASRRKRREARERAKADGSKTREASEAEVAENELREWLVNVSMENLGDYLESLYEDDLRAKARGTGAICILSQKIGNLHELAENDQLMSSVARNLKDDFKHSHVVTMGAMGFFERCSRYRSMHSLLAGKKVGAITLEILAYELQRFDHRFDKVKALGAEASGSGSGSGAVVRDGDAERRRKREIKRSATYFEKQDQLLTLCVRTLLNLSHLPTVERKMCKRDIVGHLIALCRRHVVLQESGGEHSERGEGGDPAMGKLRRVLVPDAPRGHLLLATLVFTLKLSLISSCKEEMCEALAVQPLRAIVALTAREEEEVADGASEAKKKAKVGGGGAGRGGNLYEGSSSIHGPASPTLATPVGVGIAAMKVLLNLSFDAAVRVQMRKAKLVATLVHRLKSPPFRDLSLRLMCQLSRDDDAMGAFASAEDCAPMLLQLVEHYPEPMLPQQLYGLLVNLCLHAQNAALLARGAGGGSGSSAGKRAGGRREGRRSGRGGDKGAGLRMLVRRAVKTRDPMLVKILHSLALWTFRVQCDNAAAARKASAKRTAAREAAKEEEDAAVRGDGPAAGAASSRGGAPSASSSSPTAAAGETHYAQRGLWADHVPALVQLTVDSDQPPELLVEAIGLLSCLTPEDMPKGASVASLLLETSGGGGDSGGGARGGSRAREPRVTLIEKLQGLLRPGFGSADVCLEVVKFFGAVVLDIGGEEGDERERSSGSAALDALTSSDIPRLMAELLRAKRDDADFLAQLLFTFYRWLRVPALVVVLVQDLALPDALCNFLTHPEADVRKLAQMSLDLVMLNEEAGEAEEGLFEDLRKQRFDLFNKNWLEMMRHENSSGGSAGGRDGGRGGDRRGGSGYDGGYGVGGYGGDESPGAYDDDGEEGLDLSGGRGGLDDRYLDAYDAVGDSEEEDVAELAHRDYGAGGGGRRDWDDGGEY